MPKKSLVLQVLAEHKRRIIGVSKGVVNDLRVTLKVLIFPFVLGPWLTSLFALERLYIVTGVRLFAVHLQTFRQTLTTREANWFCKTRPAPNQHSKRYSEADNSSCKVRSCLISKLRVLAGVRTTTSSPSCLPIRLLPTGDVVEINPCAGSLSSGETSLYVTSSSFSASYSTKVDPYDALSRGTLFGSIDAISLIR